MGLISDIIAGIFAYIFCFGLMYAGVWMDNFFGKIIFWVAFLLSTSALIKLFILTKWAISDFFVGLKIDKRQEFTVSVSEYENRYANIIEFIGKYKK